jgi:hypothetical protein
MFGIPADAPWIWLGLLVCSAAMFGVIVDIPAAPPDAERAATEVDDVARLPHTASARVEIKATEVKLGRFGIALRGPGGVGHAAFEFGPVTPVRQGTKLAKVLHGTPPQSVYETPCTFRRSIAIARDEEAEWRPASSSLVVRRVSYGEVDYVLVGA